MCPRIEVDFLEDWVSHHLNFGIDHIFIYNSGVEPMYNNKPKWVIKDGSPVIIRELINYQPQRPSKEINEAWEQIIKKFPNKISETKLKTEGLTRSEHDKIQASLNFSELENYNNLGFDWVFNIDGDEFLDGNLSSLSSIPLNISRLKIDQFCYSARRLEDGTPVNRSSGKLLYEAKIKICNKNIVRPQDIKAWKNVHYEVELADGKKCEWSKDIWFNHYRGHGYKEAAQLI